MRRALSSSSLSRLFLFRWLAGAIGCGVALFVLVTLQQSTGGGRTWAIIMAAPVLIVAALIGQDALTWRRLKKVAVDQRFLYVSDYADTEEVAIPLSDVRRVTQWRGKTLRPVTVFLRTPSKFGQPIRFQPVVEPGEWGWAWQENQVVQELRRLVREQPEQSA